MKKISLVVAPKIIAASLMMFAASAEYSLASEPTLDPTKSQTLPDILLYVVTLLSLLFAVISSVVAYKFYIWRHKIDVTGALVPEAWASVIDEQSKKIGLLADHISNLSSRVEGSESQINARLKILEDKMATSIDELSKTQKILMQFQTSLNEKDNEIARYKNGYDFEILKENLQSIIQLHLNTIKLMKRNPENADLGKIEYLIRDTLEQAGVSIAKPPIGKNFSEYANQVEVIGHTQEANDQAETLKKGDIVEVVSEYYEFSGAEKPSVLKKAEIKYYLPQE